MKKLMIGWTTVATEHDAQDIATHLVEEGLAACVQIDGPLRSFYRHKGELKNDLEYRLTVKYPKAHGEAIAQYIAANHPYDTPQWIGCRIREVSMDYHQWALGQTRA